MTSLKDFRRFVFFIAMFGFVIGMVKLSLHSAEITQRIINDFPSWRFLGLALWQLAVVFATRWVCYRGAEAMWRWKGLPDE